MSGTHADDGFKVKKPVHLPKAKVDTAVISQSALPVQASLTTIKGYAEPFMSSSAGLSNGSRLNPQAVRFVQNFAEKNREDLMEIGQRGKMYLDLMDGILTQCGVPGELKYLAVIESNLNAKCVSWVGAKGPWQLMPSTARLLGLKVTRHYDERTNYSKSTKAAARYLHDLYTAFGDWLLVIAAYNGGTANVYNAIKRSRSTNFWNLQYFLPAESRKHVMKFIGTHYIFEGQGSVVTLTRAEATEQLSGSAMYVFKRNLTKDELQASKTLTVSGKYAAEAIARNVNMELADFDRFNPEFDKVMASINNTYDLKLPADKMELFVANKYQILNESTASAPEDEAGTDAPGMLHDIARLAGK
jgi:membrane-bound lytic murein transglycosylase D